MSIRQISAEFKAQLDALQYLSDGICNAYESELQYYSELMGIRLKYLGRCHQKLINEIVERKSNARNNGTSNKDTDTD